jgi:hypothetical protein
LLITTSIFFFKNRRSNMLHLTVHTQFLVVVVVTHRAVCLFVVCVVCGAKFAGAKERKNRK